MSDPTARVLEDIQVERDRQNEKWGEQNHPDGTGPAADTMPRVWEALRGAGLDDTQLADAVNAMQNAGIYFREVTDGQDQGDAPDEITRLREELASARKQLDDLRSAFAAIWSSFRVLFNQALSGVRPVLVAAGIDLPDWEITQASIGTEEGSATAEITRLREDNARLTALVSAADRYGDRHVIEFRETGWGLAHPLSCRMAALFGCAFNRAAMTLEESPALGRFEVTIEDGQIVVGAPVDAETMPADLSPVERLTRAAEVLERLDRYATPGPWRYDPGMEWVNPANQAEHFEAVFAGEAGSAAITVAVTGLSDDLQSVRDAHLIAILRPLAGHVAAWLRAEADRFERAVRAARVMGVQPIPAALAVADAVLDRTSGDTTTQTTDA